MTALTNDMQFSIWLMSGVISLLSAVSCFWIIRFVKQSDKQFEKIWERVIEMDRHLVAVETKVEIHTEDISFLKKAHS